MASTIQIKRSAVAGKTPTTSDLVAGEFAINTFDGKVYIKKIQGGTESIVEVGAGGSGPATTPLCKVRGRVNDLLNNSTDFTVRAVFNATPLINVGGFSVSTTAIEVPSTGKYLCAADIFLDNDKERANVGMSWAVNSTRQIGTAATAYVRDRDGHNESSLHLTEVLDLVAGDEVQLMFARIARSGNDDLVTRTESSVSIIKLP